MLDRVFRLLVAASLVIPLGLDLYMPVPEENPLTAEKIELGRRLFNDRRLSRDGTIACVTCHDPARAFSDGRIKGSASTAASVAVTRPR